MTEDPKISEMIETEIQSLTEILDRLRKIKRKTERLETRYNLRVFLEENDRYIEDLEKMT